jgi:hypothetical protein
MKKQLKKLNDGTMGYRYYCTNEHERCFAWAKAQTHANQRWIGVRSWCTWPSSLVYISMDVTCFPLRLAVHLCGGGSEGRESGLRAEEREATNERIMVGEREARANCLSRVVLARCGRWGVGCRWCCPYFSVVVMVVLRPKPMLVLTSVMSYV